MIDALWRQWQQALGTLGPFAWSPATAPAGAGSAVPGFGPFADSAERFANAIREFIAKSQQANLSSGASEQAFAAAEGFGNFLREQFAGSFKPPWPATPPSSFDFTFAEAPALGLGRDKFLRAQRALAAWNRLTEARNHLYRMWSDTLREAASRFTARLEGERLEPLTAETVDRLYDLWIDCAEEAYGRTAHSEGFCVALSECVNAGSEWRREIAAAIEESAKLLDLPTRSEINTLTLRLRDLETQLAASKGQTSRPAKPTRTAPRPRSAKPARSAKPRPGRSKRTS